MDDLFSKCCDALTSLLSSILQAIEEVDIATNETASLLSVIIGPLVGLSINLTNLATNSTLDRDTSLLLDKLDDLECCSLPATNCESACNDGEMCPVMDIPPPGTDPNLSNIVFFETINNTKTGVCLKVEYMPNFMCSVSNAITNGTVYCVLEELYKKCALPQDGTLRADPLAQRGILQVDRTVTPNTLVYNVGNMMLSSSAECQDACESLGSSKCICAGPLETRITYDCPVPSLRVWQVGGVAAKQ